MRTTRPIPELAACLLSLIVMLTGAACGKKDPVRALLEELERAAEARDAGRVQQALADDFLGPDGLTREEAYALLRRYFAGYDEVSIEVYDIRVEQLTGGHRLAFHVDFSGRGSSAFGLGGFMPPSASYRFELELALRSGRLLVTRAQWQDAAPAQPAQEGGAHP
jgi:hypothetical protein